MILWPLLYILTAFAQEPAIEEYCFASPSRMKQVRNKASFIFVPADKVMEESNCFTVSTPPHRRELIQNYIRGVDPTVRIGFSSAEIRRDPCRIKVEKIRSTHRDGTGASAAVDLTNPSGVIISATTDQTIRTGKDVSQIQTLKEFELTVNQDVIRGECKFINPTRYEILLEVRKDALPLIPPVPPGTIVVVPDARIPKTQETSRLVTTLQLNAGEKIEIGSVVKDLKENSNKVDINNGAAVEKTDGIQTEKVFLSIE